jgi:hypothetical protein
MIELWRDCQAQRACVMQPRVRRTLGIESPHVFISPNPNGVPSDSKAIACRVSVLECSSPLELFAGQTTPESAGGPAHSRTLPRAFTLPVS